MGEPEREGSQYAEKMGFTRRKKAGERQGNIQCRFPHRMRGDVNNKPLKGGVIHTGDVMKEERDKGGNPIRGNKRIQTNRGDRNINSG